MNDFEQRQRERKARAIVRWIFAHFELDHVMHPRFLDGVAQYPQQQRDHIAEHAGVKSPSDATWVVVVQLLRDHLEIAALRPRCGATYQAGPFEPEYACHLPLDHHGYHSSGDLHWPQGVGAPARMVG